mmetsp:Transcript_15555/g.25756  ORF Transcript_15555/g.25756 Transcript_15555/m.25756 type:complete len:345 (+) Transcript_15555:88-1122(+)|eukprot:CAMPEP_0184353080 /NCGR_PEP_ID=MMETSP1089-20130417/74324_1 /TAXON_ID=38269 ORGANISM="Gloeochaete wittrockiana, Strain SAG46.84" /NCGR_SAMPLE_ID=MMETSP1089 /ASSEMBLY_ACC=CAM_ASM_000445 /LENGTH=344 /DNA_ID=CAMNT_0026688175 /DNA_START=45 /DNA_END=1079 /DNA_ORIENTATION=+
MTDAISRAYGCLLGLVCGDAAGAVLEFSNVKITDDIASKAMSMPGGGVWNVGPGQITDDSELALSLAFALCESDQKELPLNEIAANYVDWYNSNPFDCGVTCSNSFSIERGSNGLASELMIARSACRNGASESNGALMRVAPLAIWCSDKPRSVIAQFARKEASLTHPSQVVQDCSALYCIAIAHLINNPGDSAGAVQAVEEYTREENVCEKVQGWVFEKYDIESLDCQKNMGHVKWAFLLALHFLRSGQKYESAILQTLMKRGDTDTNAAIVGAILGALHGSENIPEYMSRPVLSFKCDTEETSIDGEAGSVEKEGHERPAKYNAANVKTLAKSLMSHISHDS